jgi:hypothetical protein
MPMSPHERFWRHVKKGEGCWEWQGSRWHHGYGRVVVAGHQTMAHRRAFQLTFGDFDPKLDVLHRCDNKPCVRPDHLYLGNDLDNARDRVERGPDIRFPGEANGRAKLTAADVDELRHLRALGLSYPELCRRFGVSKTAARFAVSGKTWR